MDILCLMVTAFNVLKHLVYMEHAQAVVPTRLEHNLHALIASQLPIRTLSCIREDVW